MKCPKLTKTQALERDALVEAFLRGNNQGERFYPLNKAELAELTATATQFVIARAT